MKGAANPCGNISLGFLNASYGYPFARGDLAASVSLGYVGDPSKPFPWLAWSNRPFANVGELMMVPASHPGRLLFEFVAPQMAKNLAFDPYNNNPTSLNPVYADITPINPMLNVPPWNTVYPPSGPQNVPQMRLPYNHYLNFFNSSPDSTKAADTYLYSLITYKFRPNSSALKQN